MNAIPKIQTAAMKLIFSSLFARKSKYLILGIENKPHTWYMTNINEEEILVYKPNMKQYLHEILFIKSELQDLIVSKFPILGKIIGIIDTSIVCSSINTYEKGVNPPLTMEIAADGFTIVLKNNEVSIVCGRLLSPEIVGRYASLMDAYVVRNEPKDDPRELNYPIDLGSFNSTTVNTVIIYSDKFDSLKPIWRIAVPLRDGMNMVSVAEYVKKSKAVNKVLDIVVTDNKLRTFKTVVRYIDDNIKVLSIQPAAVWFPLPSDT